MKCETKKEELKLTLCTDTTTGVSGEENKSLSIVNKIIISCLATETETNFADAILGSSHLDFLIHSKFSQQ